MTETTKSSAPKLGDHGNVAMRIKVLRAIHQTSGKFAILQHFTQPPYRAIMDQPAWSFQRQDEFLSVTGTFGFSADRGESKEARPVESDAVIRIEASFLAIYETDPGEPFSDEDALAFAQINAQLNLYPFWREFIYDALGRAGMSPFLIPPFNPIKSSNDRKRVTAEKPPAPSQGKPAD